MSKQSTLGGFAFACLLFAMVLFGEAVAAASIPDVSMALFWHPFALMLGVLALQGCSGLLAILTTILGACSNESVWGKLAVLGGPVLLIGDVAYLFWAFSLTDVS